MFIPESKRLNVLLKEFRVTHNHMAIVVDEYGGVSGLLTIEDVLEQIVGDIGDEYDVDESEGIRKEADRSWTVPALTRIEDFNQAFGTRFSDEEFDTIGGLILHELGRMPRRGEAVADRRARTEGDARGPAPHRDPARDDAARPRRAPGGWRLAGWTPPAACAASCGWGRWLALPLGACSRSPSRRPISCTCSPSLCPAACSCSGTARRRAKRRWRGFLFTVGTFLAGTYWLYHSIHLVGQAPVWVALFLMLGLVAIMGVVHRGRSVTSARAGRRPAARCAGCSLLPALWVLVGVGARLVPERIPVARARLQRSSRHRCAALRRCSACTA